MVSIDGKECSFPDLTASTASVAGVCFTATAMYTLNNDRTTKSDSVSVLIRKNDHLVKVSHDYIIMIRTHFKPSMVVVINGFLI